MKRKRLQKKLDRGELKDPNIEIDSELVDIKSVGETITGPGDMLEEKQVNEIDDAGVLKTVRYQKVKSAGCGHFIHSAADLGALCGGCGQTVCKSCSVKICQAPHCGRGVCAACRVEYEDGVVICRAHPGQRMLRGMIRFLSPGCSGGS